MSTKLTDATVRRLTTTKQQERFADPETPGLAVRVTRGGARTYVVEYTVRGTTTRRRYRIGDALSWSLADARKRARTVRQMADEGRDIQAEETELREAPTFADLWQRSREYREGQIARGERAPKTLRSERSGWARHIAPTFARQRVADVTIGDIKRWYAAIPGAALANRCRAQLSWMLGHAVDLGWIERNPMVGARIERKRERERNEDISAAEYHGVMAHLARMSDPAHEPRWHARTAARVLRLLFLTGQRKGEILDMRDHEARAESYQDPETGEARVGFLWLQRRSKVKDERRLWLSAAAWAVIEEQRADPERPGVERADRRLFPVSDNCVGRNWRVWRSGLGLDRFNPHDARHFYASTMIDAGLDLYAVADALGHANLQMSKRYAKRRDALRRNTAEAMGARLAPAPQPAEPVVALRFRKREPA